MEKNCYFVIPIRILIDSQSKRNSDQVSDMLIEILSEFSNNIQNDCLKILLKYLLFSRLYYSKFNAIIKSKRNFDKVFDNSRNSIGIPWQLNLCNSIDISIEFLTQSENWNISTKFPIIVGILSKIRLEFQSKWNSRNSFG